MIAAVFLFLLGLLPHNAETWCNGPDLFVTIEHRGIAAEVLADVAKKHGYESGGHITDVDMFKRMLKEHIVESQWRISCLTREIERQKRDLKK